MSTPASPCICNCCLNKQDVCLGCFRSLQEISEWAQATDQRKEIIIIKALQRAEQAKAESLLIPKEGHILHV